MLVFICVVTSHFLTVYFSDFHRVGINQVVTQHGAHELGMSFKVG